MKKVVSLFTVLFCVSVLHANDTKKAIFWGWKLPFTEKQVEQAKRKTKLFGVRTALWAARSQETGRLMPPISDGYYYQNDEGQDCGFFPDAGHKGQGWFACLIKGGLDYGPAKADCSLKPSLRLKDPIGRYSNPTHAKKPKTTNKWCNVYLTHGVN